MTENREMQTLIIITEVKTGEAVCTESVSAVMEDHTKAVCKKIDELTKIYPRPKFSFATTSARSLAEHYSAFPEDRPPWSEEERKEMDDLVDKIYGGKNPFKLKTDPDKNDKDMNCLTCLKKYIKAKILQIKDRFR